MRSGISRIAAILVAAATAGCLLPGIAAAAATSATAHVPLTNAAPAAAPVLDTKPNTSPAGYRLTGNTVLRIASRNSTVADALRSHPGAKAYEYTRGAGLWQVSWFGGRPAKEIIQVYVDDVTGRVTQAWTGPQVAWTMARGYAGAFGRRVNSWYIWIPLCLLFVAPFVPWRRGRPPLLLLDLAMLIGFSVSLAFFNHGAINLSVPLVYPFLFYVLIRMLLLAGRRGIPRRPLELSVPLPWLGAATVFLMAFRIGLNVLNSNVIDVGYAGVIGADKLIHGAPLYGNWPLDNRYGDTYGPFSYFTYVPFRLIFGWTGRWDNLPAAHAAAIAFDLITVAGLYVLGRRLKGNRLGIILAYLWAAYPFTLYALNSNTNDSLVSATLVVALLTLTWAPARGVMAVLAGITKFAPFALTPLLLRGVAPRLRERSVALFIVAFGITAFLVMLPVLLNHDLGYFWRDSVEYQSGRVTPFSVWGLWRLPSTLQGLLEGAVVAMGVGIALVPSQRGLTEVAALGAAILCALQVTANYWLYPYIVWFFPLAVVALTTAHPDLAPHGRPEPAPVAREAAGEPIGVRIASG